MSFAFVANARLPTRHGLFDISVYQDSATGEEHTALSVGLIGQPKPDMPILVRLHSECLTGDAFGSLRCDCGPQLEAALMRIQKAGRGALLYLKQEGRGIGLTNKIRAYALQDQGHDTLDANLLLGLPADARTYDMTGPILHHLGISHINLMTNNPAKQRALEQLGFVVVERTPLYVGLNPLNEGYLATKQQRMGHLE